MSAQAQKGQKLRLSGWRVVLDQSWKGQSPSQLVPPRPSAEYLDNDSYGNPENNSVQRIPRRFLRGCHACCTENDKGACRTYMHELRQQHTFRVRINPRDQHSHSRHGQAEREKKRQPVETMWSGGAKIVDYR